MRISSCLLYIACVLISSASLVADSQWAMVLGEPSATYYVSGLQQTTDGGYVVTGWRRAKNLKGYQVWKLDSGGKVLWQKTFGQNLDRILYNPDIQQTSDGGFILAGFFQPAEGTEAAVIKLDSVGNVLWQKSFPAGVYSIARSVRQTNDGGYIVGGSTDAFPERDTDIWILKLDSSGNIVWQKTFGGADSDQAVAVRQISDGGYVVAANSSSFDLDNWPKRGPKLLTLKLDASGNLLWHKIIGGPFEDITIKQVEPTREGGYVFMGYIDSFPNKTGIDLYVLKTNATGKVTWQRAYGGGSTEFGYSIRQTKDGGYIALGSTASSGFGSTDIWVLKLNKGGSPQWQRVIGRESYDTGAAVQETKEGAYVVGGLITGFSGSQNSALVLLLSTSGVGCSAVTVSSDLKARPANTISPGGNLTVGNTSAVAKEVAFKQSPGKTKETSVCQ